MAEVVEKTGVTKEKGYLYYLDKQGDVSRSKMARAGKGGGNAEKVATAGVTRESGYLYFIDKNYAVFLFRRARHATAHLPCRVPCAHAFLSSTTSTALSGRPIDKNTRVVLPCVMLSCAEVRRL